MQQPKKSVTVKSSTLHLGVGKLLADAHVMLLQSEARLAVRHEGRVTITKPKQ